MAWGRWPPGPGWSCGAETAQTEGAGDPRWGLLQGRDEGRSEGAQGEMSTAKLSPFWNKWFLLEMREVLEMLRELLSGGPSGVWTPRGAWAQNLLKIGGFPLKISWKLHDVEEILGARRAPLDPFLAQVSQLTCVKSQLIFWCFHSKKTHNKTYTGISANWIDLNTLHNGLGLLDLCKNPPLQFYLLCQQAIFIAGVHMGTASVLRVWTRWMLSPVQEDVSATQESTSGQSLRHDVVTQPTAWQCKQLHWWKQHAWCKQSLRVLRLLVADPAPLAPKISSGPPLGPKLHCRPDQSRLTLHGRPWFRGISLTGSYMWKERKVEHQKKEQLLVRIRGSYTWDSAGVDNCLGLHIHC